VRLGLGHFDMYYSTYILASFCEAGIGPRRHVLYLHTSIVLELARAYA
jgi:hypothetical protein